MAILVNSNEVVLEKSKNVSECLFLWRKTTYFSYIVINFITWIQLYEER
jgi:hypothetical protein